MQGGTIAPSLWQSQHFLQFACAPMTCAVESPDKGLHAQPVSMGQRLSLRQHTCTGNIGMMGQSCNGPRTTQVTRSTLHRVSSPQDAHQQSAGQSAQPCLSTQFRTSHPLRALATPQLLAIQAAYLQSRCMPHPHPSSDWCARDG